MKIHLRFIRDDGIISRLIRWQDWSSGGSYSHVEFRLPTGYLGSQAPDGVKLRPLNYCTPTEEWLCCVDVPDYVGEKILEFARAQIGKPYDWKAIVGFIIRRDWMNDNSWTCSELVTFTFLQAGFPLLRTHTTNRISPDTLALSPYIKGYL